jgi:hypothetical protein
MIYNIVILALIKMMILAPPPTRPVREYKPSRWQLVLMASGKIIDPIPPPSPEVFTVAALDIGAITKLAEIELGSVDHTSRYHQKSATPKRWQPGEGFGNTR